MVKKILLLVTAVSLCLLFIILNITTPVSSGPIGVLLVFVFAYVSSVGLMTFLLFTLSKVATYLSVVVVARKPLQRLSFRRSYYYSTIVGSAPVLVVALQSVGANGMYEYLLVLIFVVIGCLYISKRID